MCMPRCRFWLVQPNRGPINTGPSDQKISDSSEIYSGLWSLCVLRHLKFHWVQHNTFWPKASVLKAPCLKFSNSSKTEYGDVTLNSMHDKFLLYEDSTYE